MAKDNYIKHMSDVLSGYSLKSAQNLEGKKMKDGRNFVYKERKPSFDYLDWAKLGVGKKEMAKIQKKLRRCSRWIITP